MTITRNNFYIITGGPGSGKTTMIDMLKERKFLCVNEVARQIIQEQTKMNGDALHTKNQLKFRDLMLLRSIATFQEVAEMHNPVFFDRGIPELIGYCRLIKSPVPEQLLQATRVFRYNKIVFVTPPWEEIYALDDERQQTWEEAIATYQHIATAYVEAGYQLCEIPKGTVSARVEYILESIASINF